MDSDLQRQVEVLQGCINDLVSLLALPALWSGRDPSHVVETLLSVLSRMLRLDFAYARLNSFAALGEPVELLRVQRGRKPAPPARDVGLALEPWFSPNAPTLVCVIPNPVGEGELPILQSWLGFEKGGGVVVVGAERGDFPSDIERLLLNVAVSQTVIELQRGQVLAEHNRAEENRRQRNRLQAENLYLRQELDSERNFGEIVGGSAALRSVEKLIEQVAPTNACVLIQGETGTGKELVARAIHRLSGRNEHAFVKLNCAAVPTGLLEAELFGHERGAFTGAIAQRIGRFDLANRGTLFLDEVGEIPLEIQAKLLRVLQEQEFERLGSTRTIHVDVRIVAASNRDLAEMVAERTFRSDLYYRLKVFPILVPPLRERAEDIPLLVQHFIDHHARQLGKPVTGISQATMAALTGQSWPGNVRELENFIERSVILSTGATLEVPLGELALVSEQTSAKGTLEEVERAHILDALRASDWVLAGRAGAAAKLGLARTTLQHRMQKLGIARPA
ncbi:MAG TPA: sigma 54-interacting transcriptional regulator [Myxococcota bacterium]|nr:sigma 54-interacting transcriptional regulator [Myxococcota bacterium]